MSRPATVAFPATIPEALATEGEVRAGGTELTERRRLPGQGGPLVDLRDTAGLDVLLFDAEGRLHIGSTRTIAEIAAHPDVQARYPGLSAAASGLATPQIRAVATVGGNLLQSTRCWYFRAPQAGPACFKRGGDGCAARDGDHLWGPCFDLGPCASVHPSTLGAALLAYDAEVEVEPGGRRSVLELLGDGSDPARDHQLAPSDLLRAVVLPPPRPGERAAYVRAISRARAEWPLAEVVARLVLEGETIVEAAVAVGGVAAVPLRLGKVEEALRGAPATLASLERAAALASQGASPLRDTAYKLRILEGGVLDALEQALAADPVAPSATASSPALPRSPAPTPSEETP